MTRLHRAGKRPAPRRPVGGTGRPGLATPLDKSFSISSLKGGDAHTKCTHMTTSGQQTAAAAAATAATPTLADENAPAADNTAALAGTAAPSDNVITIYYSKDNV